MSRLLAIAVALVLFVGCAPRNPALTPHSKAILNADTVVLRLGELGDTAIVASNSGAIPRASAEKVAHFVIAGVATCKAAPDGWQAAVKALWAALRQDLDASVKTKLGAVWTTLDGLLGGA